VGRSRRSKQARTKVTFAGGSVGQASSAGGDGRRRRQPEIGSAEGDLELDWGGGCRMGNQQGGEHRAQDGPTKGPRGLTCCFLFFIYMSYN